MEFFHKKTSFPFMATRKVWYTLSAILMIVSFASFYERKLNFAIDFTGGVAVEASFPKDVSVETVRQAVINGGFHEPQVSHLGNSRTVSIGLQITGKTTEQLRPVFTDMLMKIDPAVHIDNLEIAVDALTGNRPDAGRRSNLRAMGCISHLYLPRLTDRPAAPSCRMPRRKRYRSCLCSRTARQPGSPSCIPGTGLRSAAS